MILILKLMIKFYEIGPRSVLGPPKMNEPAEFGLTLAYMYTPNVEDLQSAFRKWHSHFIHLCKKISTSFVADLIKNVAQRGVNFKWSCSCQSI